MRRIKQWDAEITADVLTNILQPGRFAQLDQNLTIRIRERQPGGVLAGIFVDDRRDPKERVTIIADHGTVLKNDSGSFLILEDGNLERFEAGKRDPALVAFGRYAFDMSKFSNQGRDVTLGIRERYLWELLSPAEDDPIYKQLPGQFRAELHDRFMAPIYPFAFAALTFAFLGAPRTTRQSRNFSIGGSIFAVFGLRMAGFACSVMAVKIAVARRWSSISMLFGGDRRRAVDDRRRRRGRTAGRADGGHQQIERAPRAAVRTAGHRMSMMTNTLGRYFAGRFVVSAVGVFASIFVLLVLVDYIEMVRKTSGLASASAITVAETSLFRVPQLLEKMMPFCVLIGAMTCYLALSRRLELVVARAAGVSAWQFIAPALASAILLGVARHHRLQSDVGESARTLQADGSRAVRLGARRRHPGRLRLLAQPGQQRRPVDHQRRAQRAAGRAADRPDRVPIRYRLPVQGANRGARGDAGRRALGCSNRCAATRSTSRRSTRTASTSRPP